MIGDPPLLTFLPSHPLPPSCWHVLSFCTAALRESAEANSDGSALAEVTNLHPILNPNNEYPTFPQRNPNR